MLTQPADANGRDTPTAGKVSCRLSALDVIRAAGSGKPAMALRTRGEQLSMVDQESGTYRPRRAFIEPDVEPALPERPAQPSRNGNGRAFQRPEPFDELRAPVEGRASTSSARKPATPRVDEDQPKPLYRDEARLNGSPRSPSRAAPIPADPPTKETLMTPATLAPRRPPILDDETTTILPRSRPTKHRTQALDAIDDYDDDDERRTLGRHAKLALLIAGVAAVVIVGLLIGYAVRSAAKQPQTQSNLAPSRGPSSDAASQPPGQSGSALLTDASMLSPSQAKTLDRNASWKVVTTDRTATEDSPTAACFGGEPLEGQPTPQQEVVRVLKAGGKNDPVALHAAMAYSSPEEATQAYAIASKTLGGCAVAGYYIASGYSVSGIGDQAVGVVVMEVQGKKTQAHSVVLNRTGRVVNVLDAAQPSQAIAMDAVAKALSQVNAVICRGAGGRCDGKVSVKHGPPPLGGDEPGFLAIGDLPPAGPKVYPWVATQVELPKKEFQGSGCETVNWTTQQAKSRSSRVYLIPESGNSFFGLNEIMLTTKDAKAAGKVVDKIKSDFSRCKSRNLTATVTGPTKVTSIGAQKAQISGWTAVIKQKSTKGVAKYRVGIVSAGPKVIYTFLNPRGAFDFKNRQWDTVAVRAGERATQVP